MASETFDIIIRGVDDTTEAFRRARRNADDLTDRLDQNSNAIRGMSRQARAQLQQVGYQVQDIAVMLQAGQSPFIILAQQGSQVASAFGPVGAMIGTALALGGVMASSLAPQLMNSAGASKELEESTEALVNALERAEDGTYSYGNALKETSTYSQTLLNIELQRAFIEAAEAADAAVETIQEKFGSMTSFIKRAVSPSIGNVGEAFEQLQGVEDVFNTLTAAVQNYQANMRTMILEKGSVEFVDVSRAVNYVKALRTISKELNLGEKEAIKFVEIFASINTEMSKQDLEIALAGLKRYSQGSVEAQKFVSDLSDAFKALIRAQELSGQSTHDISQNTKRLSEEADNAASKIADLKQEIYFTQRAMDQGFFGDALTQEVKRLNSIFTLVEQGASMAEAIDLVNVQKAQQDFNEVGKAFEKMQAKLAKPTRQAGQSTRTFALERQLAAFNELNDAMLAQTKNERRYEAMRAQIAAWGAEQRAVIAEEEAANKNKRKSEITALERFRKELSLLEQTVGMTTAEIKAFEQANLGASEEEIQSYQRLTQAQQDFLSSHRQIQEAYGQAEDAIASLQKARETDLNREIRQHQERITALENYWLITEMTDQEFMEKQLEYWSAHYSALQEIAKRNTPESPINSWIEQASEDAVNFEQLIADSLSHISSSFGDTFAEIVLNSENAGEALQNMVSGFARMFISSLGEMLAKFILVQLMQKTFLKGAMGAAAASTVMQTQSMVLQAGLNAFAATAAIPVIGPGLAPAAAATAIGAAQPMATAAQTLAASAAAFKDGGSFMVGGVGGPDSQMVAFKASPNERVTIETPEQMRAREGGQAGDTIVLNQTISVSTGVQQTVRNEIYQMMPQIAAVSKAAVLDAKKRGGHFAQTFRS